jgi:glycosyltransferase involved in cell wall biosynthesis
MTTISVIVPTLNRNKEILHFIRTLKNQTMSVDELIVVDAGEGSDLKEQLIKALEGSNINLQYATSEAGTSLQRNVAIDICKGDILFFFDDDILLEPDYVEQTMKCFELQHSPRVGGVLGTFTSSYKTSKAKEIYSKIFRITHSIEGNKAKLMATGAVQWLIRPNDIVRVPVCSGGRVAYRRECFDDERWATFLPGYTMSEDVEISFRLSKKWTLLQNPDALLYHDKSDGGRNSQGDRFARLIYSRFYFFHNHRKKTPQNLFAFAWWNLGILGLVGAHQVRTQTSDPIDLLKGIQKGYRLCWNDIVEYK